MTSPYVGLALYAEGSSDHRFLDVLLRRATEALLISRGFQVQVSDVQRLEIPDDEALKTRATRIARGAANIQGAFHLLFVHADGGNDPARARCERVDPGIEAVKKELGTDRREAVGVVPVRETEAWALADADALRSVLSSARSPADLGIPTDANEIEALPDPKRQLDLVVQRARGGRRGIRVRRASFFLDRLAERIDLASLRRLRAYRAFEDELETALDALGYRE